MYRKIIAKISFRWDTVNIEKSTYSISAVFFSLYTLNTSFDLSTFNTKTHQHSANWIKIVTISLLLQIVCESFVCRWITLIVDVDSSSSDYKSFCTSMLEIISPLHPSSYLFMFFFFISIALMTSPLVTIRMVDGPIFCFVLFFCFCRSRHFVFIRTFTLYVAVADEFLRNRT